MASLEPRSRSEFGDFSLLVSFDFLQVNEAAIKTEPLLTSYFGCFKSEIKVKRLHMTVNRFGMFLGRQ